MGYRYKKAFTMAEAILVMTILGIIATIMITTLKPAHFKEKALEILAKKVINEIDTATSLILNNNSADGTMQTLFLDKPENYFAFGSDYSKIKTLYSKYLAISRKEFSVGISGFADLDNYISSSSAAYSQAKPFYLKDGALIYLGVGEALGGSSSNGVGAQNLPSDAICDNPVSGVEDWDTENYWCGGINCSEEFAMANCSCEFTEIYRFYSIFNGDCYVYNGNWCDCTVNPPGADVVSTPALDCPVAEGSLLGMLFVDINGEEEPNTVYLDQFYIPIGVHGIIWEQFCMKKP